MTTYYIGTDVHDNNTDLAIEKNGKIVKYCSVATTIPAISAVLEQLQGRKHMAIEEGPMAGWLYRNLSDKVDKLIICDPRRNKLIACDGDSNDRIDSTKLAALLRGNYLRQVYHSKDDNRVRLRYWVSLYDGRVRDTTRNINKLRACCRMHGVKIPARAIHDAVKRQEWFGGLGDSSLAELLRVLWIGYDATRQQTRAAKRQMIRLARTYAIIGYWTELTGIGMIRAITLFAYLDTPYRFGKKNRVWKYCGVGLVHNASGRDKYGRPKPGRLKLAWRVNKRLKNAILGAATSAINHKNNVFKDYYERMIENGVTNSNARHAVARKMLGVMWGMWKNHSRFDASIC